MNVSVAMCTYNGGEYLQPQFESILKQTRPPDEIVIFDDCSTDGTREVLSEYAEEYPELISLHMNDQNIGLDQNFGRAIRACSGDVIAISDQDDIWDLEKLERQLDVFQHRDAALVFHNSTVATESLDPISTLWETLTPEYRPSNNEPNEQFRSLVRRNFVQGATMLFDVSLREYCLPIPDYWFYDYWIATVAAYRGGVHGIDETMLTYRQHEKQAIGASDDSILDQVKLSMNVGREQYHATVDQWTTLYNTIEQTDDSEIVVKKEDALRAVRLRVRYAESRALIYEGPPLAGAKHCFRNLREGNYRLYGNGWRSAIKDIGRISLSTIERIGK